MPNRPKPHRQVKGTAETTILLEKLPRQLIDDAKAKCKAEMPPMALKWKIVQLLKGWVYGEPTAEHR